MQFSGPLIEILATYVQHRFTQVIVGSTNTPSAAFHALLLLSKHY